MSQNLGISFTDLKKQMVTQSGASAQPAQTKSLGQAIQAVKKTADATTEAQKAEISAPFSVLVLAVVLLNALFRLLEELEVTVWDAANPPAFTVLDLDSRHVEFLTLGGPEWKY